MNKKNGFTLIELLAVIVIIGLVAIIAIPAISKTVKNSKNNSLDIQEKLFLEAGTNYFLDQIANNNLKFDLYEEKSVTLDTLINLGYIKPIKDPGTGDNCDGNSIVKAVFAGNRKYEYASYFTCGKYTTTQDNNHFNILNYSFLNGAKEYAEANPSVLPVNIGDRVSVLYTTLKTGGYVGTIQDVSSGNECSTKSLVVIKKTGSNSYKYLSGLICENYFKVDAWDFLLEYGLFKTDSNNDELADGWLEYGLSEKKFDYEKQTIKFASQSGYIRTGGTAYLIEGEVVYYWVLAKGATSNYVRFSTGSTFFGEQYLSDELKITSRRSVCNSTGVYYFTVNEAKTSGFLPVELRKAIAFNLTHMYGAGNEPDETKIESLMKNSGY